MKRLTLWGTALISVGAAVVSLLVPVRPYEWTGEPGLASEVDPDAWVVLMLVGALGLVLAAPAGVFGRGTLRGVGIGLGLLHALRLAWLGLIGVS